MSEPHASPTSSSTNLSQPPPPYLHSSPNSPTISPSSSTPTAPFHTTSSEFLSSHISHSLTATTNSNLTLQEAQKTLNLLIDMKIFKDLEGDVFEACDIEYFYETNQKVKRLGQRVKG
jgi:hypothetical protein